MGLKLVETSKDYYLLVSPAKLAEKFREMGYEGVVNVENVEITARDIRLLQKLNKGILIIFYFKKRTPEYEKLIADIKSSGIRMRFYSPDNIVGENETFSDMDEFANEFADKDHMESIWHDRGITRSWDYTGLCGNCHNKLEPDDKYCRKCGTKRGFGKFEPYFNDTCVYYGSPLIFKYRCKDCGTEWQYTGYNEGRYCPTCGKLTDNFMEPPKELWAELFNISDKGTASDI